MFSSVAVEVSTTSSFTFGDVSVLFVRVSVVFVPTRVVVASGRLTVLSAVGSTTYNVVS